MKKKESYILVDLTGVKTGKKYTKGYENFEELKEEVVKILDGRGWDNKERVDLRSVSSCLDYVLEGNYRNITHKLSLSHNKFMEYRYGTRAIV